MDSQTDTALQLQIGVLEALLQLLHQEERCLQSGIMTELEPIAAEKERLYQTISALESQRRTQSSTVTRMGLQAQRRALLEKIVQHNQQNGQIIGALERFNQGAWQILFGTNDPLYTDGGTTQNTTQRHLIGSA